MTQTATKETKIHAEGSACSMDKAKKAGADKGSCSTQHKSGECSGKN